VPSAPDSKQVSLASTEQVRTALLCPVRVAAGRAWEPDMSHIRRVAS
jgi:hypothetical protein